MKFKAGDFVQVNENLRYHPLFDSDKEKYISKCGIVIDVYGNEVVVEIIDRELGGKINASCKYFDRITSEKEFKKISVIDAL